MSRAVCSMIQAKAQHRLAKLRAPKHVMSLLHVHFVSQIEWHTCIFFIVVGSQLASKQDIAFGLLKASK